MKWQRSFFSHWVKNSKNQKLSKRDKIDARNYAPGTCCGFPALVSWALIKRKHRGQQGHGFVIQSGYEPTKCPQVSQLRQRLHRSTKDQTSDTKWMLSTTEEAVSQDEGHHPHDINRAK